ncbi:uncharacterized protein PHACADRAFT_173147 [Phanerochaete carnosa HHB-10118-sp]|uniref:BTB domain-containing protein n=1 Tax=Phanerochaete carnosa (strain HHB-10118-sp) TaxID=650164 RepID=K5UY76_PHACS|nr:uncharacterized protein PHACADRAFT_173147 [Phanerochaete carnosa HHB-10118-sp]EKM55076.1 hypothetical protein PHACADRAFT_173147 [Phanerochaete carnosa HHB-10118-sp]
MDDSPTPANINSSKHPSLYFEDGDLELSAETSGGSQQLFRVYGAQLRCVSPVFSDVLALGGPRDEIVMMPDSAEDLSALLEFVCIPSSLVRRLKTTPESQCAVELLGLARIARKYRADDITAVIVEHVEEQWPRGLKAWDASCAIWRTKLETVATGESVPERPEPVSAIKFALEFDAPSILPAAFYMLSVQGFGGTTTTTTTASPGAKGVPSAARWDLADPAILLSLIRGRDRVRSKFLECLAPLSCYPTLVTSSGLSSRKDRSTIALCNRSKDAILGLLMCGRSAPSLCGQWDYLEILRLCYEQVKVCEGM